MTETGGQLTYYERCDEEVIRRGQSEPCEKVAVGIRLDPRFDGPYAVCARHARGPRMVALVDIIKAARKDTLP